MAHVKSLRSKTGQSLTSVFGLRWWTRLLFFAHVSENNAGMARFHAYNVTDTRS